MELAAEHRQGEEWFVLRPGGELERLGMDHVSPFMDERKQLDVDSPLLDGEYLVEDEGLGEAWEARHHVSDLQPLLQPISGLRGLARGRPRLDEMRSPGEASSRPGRHGQSHSSVEGRPLARRAKG